MKNSSKNQAIRDTKKIISSLSIDIACLLDEPSEVTRQDLIKIQDLITLLESSNDQQNKTKTKGETWTQ